MKKSAGCTILASILLFNVLAVQTSAVSPSELFSEAAILIDADTGQVLFEKNAEQKMYPASTTKIMTALLGVEHLDPNEILTVSQSAIDIKEPGSANIALQPGERIAADHVLFGLMLPSANDAANVLAESIAGTEEAFARMMTERAHQIGAVNTSYANAHGLHDPNHYTTAYDLALITQAAMQNSSFMRYFGGVRHTMPATNLQPQERPFTNYQSMLVPETYYYDSSVIGGKVGFTDEAQHTMSTVATRDGRTLICVVMYSTSRYDKFKDTQKLLDYGFNQFVPHVLDQKSISSFTIPVQSDGRVVGTASLQPDGQNITVLLREDISPDSLIMRYNAPDRLYQGEDVEGSVSLLLKDAPAGVPSVVYTVPLSSQIRSYQTVSSAERGVIDLRRVGSAISGALEGKGFVVVLVAAGLVLVLCMKYHAQQKKLRRQRERRERLRRERLLMEQRDRNRSAGRSVTAHETRSPRRNVYTAQAAIRRYQ